MKTEKNRLKISYARSLILFAALFVGTQPAYAQENVQARGWAKPSYGRIVFDWPQPVEHSARIEGASLVVEFTRPMRADLTSVVGSLGDYVTGAEVTGKGKVARFDLAGNFSVDSFATGASVVVDLRRRSAAVAPLRTGAGSGGLAVKVGRHPGFTRLVFDWPDRVDYSIARDGRSVSMRFDRAAGLDVQKLDDALPKPAFGTPSATSSGGNLIVSLTIPELSYIRHFREDSKIVLDVQEQGGDFGNTMLVGATAGTVMETISPSGEVLVVPAMVGSHVAVSSEGSIPLVTEEGDGFQGTYSPLTHYDPNATGRPTNLLLYDRKVNRKPLKGS